MPARRSWLLRCCLATLAACALLALLAGWLAPYDPYAVATDRALQAPSWQHLFGTDRLGRDLFSRVLLGARSAVLVAAGATLTGLLLGGSIGLVAAWCGGRVDRWLSRLVDAGFAVPDLLLALTVLVALGRGTGLLVLALGIVYAPAFARVTRGAVRAVLGEAWLDAARCLGLSGPRIVLRHVLPNACDPILVQCSLCAALAILAEAALGFLGIGVEPDAPSWGLLLRDGKDLLEQAWWLSVFPGLAITGLAVVCNLTGDSLRDARDPLAR